MTGKGVKAMLECKQYPAPEIWKYVGARDNEGAKRKLNRYGVACFVNGRGESANFNITAVTDPFKVYCVFDMGFDPHSNFTKLRNYLFFLLGEDEYCWLPDEPMEQYMRSKGYSISRQTISKYREHLKSLGYIGDGDYIYYRVYRDENDKQQYQQVKKEEYCWAWRLYWEKREEGWDSEGAYSCMYSAFGGVPRKQAVAEQNGIYLKQLNYLFDLVSNSIEKEVSNRR